MLCNFSGSGHKNSWNGRLWVFYFSSSLKAFIYDFQIWASELQTYHELKFLGARKCLWGSHLIPDMHGSIAHVRTVQKRFHFYNYPKILSSSPFSAWDCANVPFAVKQTKATKTCSKGLHKQTWVNLFLSFPLDVDLPGLKFPVEKKHEQRSITIALNNAVAVGSCIASL